MEINSLGFPAFSGSAHSNISNSQNLLSVKDIFNYSGIKPSQDEIKTETTVYPTPEVVVLKKGGLKAILEGIKNAQRNVNIKSYIFTDTTSGDIVKEIKNAALRGVKVNVMIEEKPFYWKPDEPNPSQHIVNKLQKIKNVNFKWANSNITNSRAVTHEKSITIDGNKAYILTGNLGNSAFNSNLDIGAFLINNPNIVKEIDNLFTSDWDRTEFITPQNTPLVISPNNSREKIINMIKNAKTSVYVLQQEIFDDEFVKTLIQKKNSGINVKLIIANPSTAQGNIPFAMNLKKNGIDISYLDSPYVHAKALTVDTLDENPDNNLSFIGSQNFSASALGRKDGKGNRELGIIFDDKEESLQKIFNDYEKDSIPFSSKQVFTETRLIETAIRKASSTCEKSIICQTNVFTNQTIANALSAAGDRGVSVTVMMPLNPFNDPEFQGNMQTAKILAQHKVKIKWTDKNFKSIGGSTIVFDSNEAFISPDNLTVSAVAKNKSFGIIDVNPDDAGYLKRRLEIDLNKIDNKPIENIDQKTNIITPEERENKTHELLESAKYLINIETKELSSNSIITQLEKKAKDGLKVSLILEDNLFNSEVDKDNIKRLTKAGASVEFLNYSPVTNNYIQIDDEKFILSGGNLIDSDLKNTNTYGILIDELKNIQITKKEYNQDFLTAQIYQAEKLLLIEKKSIIYPADSSLLEIFFNLAKKGVRIQFNISKVGNLDLKAKTINDLYKEISSLNPENQDDLIKILKFYSYKKPEQAIEAHKKLVKTFSELKPDESLVTIQEKNWDQIKEEFIIADDKKIALPYSKFDKPEGSFEIQGS